MTKENGNVTEEIKRYYDQYACFHPGNFDLCQYSNLYHTGLARLI